MSLFLSKFSISFYIKEKHAKGDRIRHDKGKVKVTQYCFLELLYESLCPKVRKSIVMNLFYSTISLNIYKNIHFTDIIIIYKITLNKNYTKKYFFNKLSFFPSMPLLLAIRLCLHNVNKKKKQKWRTFKKLQLVEGPFPTG